MNANDIIEIIVNELDNLYDWKGVLDVLEDGEALAAIGIPDSEIEAVEAAHSIVISRI